MRVAVITISDTVSQGTRSDASGPAVSARCEQLGWKIVSATVVPDDTAFIRDRLTTLAGGGDVDLILTTGGTGLGPRDVTPEATAQACQMLVPGIPEAMREYGRKKNPRAIFSRAVAGVLGATLVINLPGSPNGATESLDAVAELLPHAMEVLRGARHD